MRILFFFLIILISSTPCFAQSNRVEKQLMNCWYDALGDAEDKVKAFIVDYQKLLIRENLLKDSTAKSYRALVKKIAEDGVINKPSKSFLSGVNEIRQPEVEGYEECMTEVIGDSVNYKAYTFKRFRTVFDSIRGIDNYTRADIAKGLISVLDEDDFTIEYYRLRTFFIYDLIILSEIWDIKFLDDASTIAKDDLAGALRVYMNTTGDIYIDESKTTVQQFKRIVREYEQYKKSKSVILVKTDNDVLYGDYVRLQEMITNEISFLREKYSLQKFGIKYGNLEEGHKREVSAVFPEKIVEHTPQ